MVGLSDDPAPFFVLSAEQLIDPRIARACASVAAAPPAAKEADDAMAVTVDAATSITAAAITFGSAGFGMTRVCVAERPCVAVKPKVGVGNGSTVLVLEGDTHVIEAVAVPVVDWEKLGSGVAVRSLEPPVGVRVADADVAVTDTVLVLENLDTDAYSCAELETVVETSFDSVALSE